MEKPLPKQRNGHDPEEGNVYAILESIEILAQVDVFEDGSPP
jgi:hypothetical protein